MYAYLLLEAYLVQYNQQAMGTMQITSAHNALNTKFTYGQNSIRTGCS